MVDDFPASVEYVVVMAKFAITAVFEVLDESPRLTSALGRPEALPVASASEESERFCAFTADSIRVVEDESPREAGRLRHPAYVSWLQRQGTDREQATPHGFGTDHRAA